MGVMISGWRCSLQGSEDSFERLRVVPGAHKTTKGLTGSFLVD
jgi:hypothetical protein